MAGNGVLDAPAPSTAGCTAPAVRSCRDCGQAQRIPALAPRTAARCRRCGALLRQAWADPLAMGLALNLACLVLFAAGAATTLAMVETQGRSRTAGLFSGPAALVQNGLWELGTLVFATTVAAPPLVAGLSVYVLGGLRLRRPPPGLALAFRLRNRLRPWSMIEVFLVGYFVAYTKLGALARIEPGPGIFALFGFMVATIAADALLDRQAVWEAIARRAPVPARQAARPASSAAPRLLCCPACELACETPGGQPPRQCPRCGAALHWRKPGSMARTAALTLSAMVFYVPANAFPVLTVIQAGRGGPSTILGGVWELLADREWSLAVIVFGASVAVPVLKILALCAMLAVTLRPGRHGPPTHLRHVTALYRVVMVIGRWSMIDIFMEALLSALVQFGTIANVTTNPGALAFAATVVLTIFAAEGFDPRLMWDAAAR
ncbi:MAG: paraquat-inducible protein A [Janthinobacterium lividum]